MLYSFIGVSCRCFYARLKKSANDTHASADDIYIYNVFTVLIIAGSHFQVNRNLKPIPRKLHTVPEIINQHTISEVPGTTPLTKHLSNFSIWKMIV